MLKLMIKLWTDALFLFAVLAGLIYELIYEPIYALASYGVRIAVKVTTGTWRRVFGELHSGTA